jgi:Skp family chaperone for outer membrane proteins
MTMNEDNLSKEDQSALNVWRSKLADGTNSQEQHAEAHRMIDQIMGKGLHGVVGKVKVEVVRLQTRVDFLEGQVNDLIKFINIESGAAEVWANIRNQMQKEFQGKPFQQQGLTATISDRRHDAPPDDADDEQPAGKKKKRRAPLSKQQQATAAATERAKKKSAEVNKRIADRDAAIRPVVNATGDALPSSDVTAAIPGADIAKEASTTPQPMVPKIPFRDGEPKVPTAVAKVIEAEMKKIEDNLDNLTPPKAPFKAGTKAQVDDLPAWAQPDTSSGDDDEPPILPAV